MRMELKKVICLPFVLDQLSVGFCFRVFFLISPSALDYSDVFVGAPKYLARILPTLVPWFALNHEQWPLPLPCLLLSPWP